MELKFLASSLSCGMPPARLQSAEFKPCFFLSCLPPFPLPLSKRTIHLLYEQDSRNYSPQEKLPSSSFSSPRETRIFFPLPPSSFQRKMVGGESTHTPETNFFCPLRDSALVDCSLVLHIHLCPFTLCHHHFNMLKDLSELE